MLRSTKAIIIARTLEIVIGLYFIAGVAPKALDIDKFVVQMSAYKVLQSPESMFYSALFTLFVETALGVALVLALRNRGLTVAVMQGMLVVFSGLITYAWIVHGLEDCGCFPILKMSPQASLVKNTLIFAAGFYMFAVFQLPELSQWRKQVSERKGIGVFFSIKDRNKNIAAVIKGMTALFAAAMVVFYAWHDMDQSAFAYKNSEEKTVSFGQFDLYLPEGHFNLNEGVYLAPVMSMSCDECMEKVPELNDLFLSESMPPMVALCYEDKPGDLDEFRAITMPLFPLYSLGDRALLYYALVGQDSFRFCIVKEGQLVSAWDGQVPSQEEILAIIQEKQAS